MNSFLIYLVSGLTLGATFALIGSGFVMVYRVTHVVNFTQGSLAVVGGLTSYSLLNTGLPHGVSELLAVGISGAVGVLFGAIAIGKRGTPPMISLLVTLSLSILTSGIVVLIWGQTPLSPGGLDGSVKIFGASLGTQRLLVVAVGTVAFIVIGLFFGYSYLGKGLTAAASNPRAAALVGISTRKMGLVAFGIAGLLGGLAGVVTAPYSPLSFTSDLPLALSGFAAAVFGGLSSPGLTLVGGLILGVAGQVVAGYFGGSFQTVVALIMLLVVMIVRHKSLTVEEAK